MLRYDGKLITFEGGEGVGKSTLLYNLEQSGKLRKDTIYTKEPGDVNGASKMIRHILMTEYMDPEAETLLFLADRSIHNEQIIKPALKKGAFVLCDRYEDSNEVYQCYGKGLDKSVFTTLKAGLGHVTPHLIFWLDMDAEEALERRKSCGNLTKFDKESVQFHKTIRKGFGEVLGNRPLVYRIDASQHEEEVMTQVLGALHAHVPEVFK